MASVLGRNEIDITEIICVGRCLRGLLDGEAIFRYVGQEPRKIRLVERIPSIWFEEGWYSRNLLDE